MRKLIVNDASIPTLTECFKARTSGEEFGLFNVCYGWFSEEQQKRVLQLSTIFQVPTNSVNLEPLYPTILRNGWSISTLTPEKKKEYMWRNIDGIPDLDKIVLALANTYAKQTDFDEVVLSEVSDDKDLATWLAEGLDAKADFSLSWSCKRNWLGHPCGECDGCAERKAAFAKLGVPDPSPSQYGPA